jgi:hypothetical protein
MLFSLLIIASTAIEKTENVDSLRMTLELSANEVGLGDPLFVRVVVENVGEDPITAPCSYSREGGGLRFKLTNGEGVSITLRPQGRGFGGVKHEILMSGERKYAYDCLLLPLAEKLEDPFWKPGAYSLSAHAHVSKDLELRCASREIRLQPRRPEELAAIGRLLALEDERRVIHFELATLDRFGVRGFALRASELEHLKALEAVLGKGGMLDAVQLTRMVREYRLLEDPDARKRAILRIKARVLEMPQIQREWMSNQIALYGIIRPDRLLLELSAEFASLAPDDWGCASGRRENLASTIQTRLKSSAKRGDKSAK